MRKRATLCLFLFLTVSLMLFLPACQGNSTENILHEAASAHHFSLVDWHLKNLPSKLISTLSNVKAIPLEEQKEILDDFFELRAEIVRLERELASEVVLQGDSIEIEVLEGDLQAVRLSYSELAPRAESVIEKEVTRTLAAEGVGFTLTGRHFIFPAALFVFQQTPNLLVVSPRDRIERLDDRLLCSSITVSQMEIMENQISQCDNLSGIVVRLGGIASYPSIVRESSGFYRSIFLAAHEWTHQYLFFYPLGRAYFDGGIGREMNETVADIVGYEIADQIYRSYGYEPPLHQPPPTTTGFDYNAEMHQTRLVAESLLDEGKIDEAEQYMEERRQFFVQEGYNIRKLNQAYFAFHGTYALDPASVSPVGKQFEELRGYYGTLGEFVMAVRELRTHEELLALLEEKCNEVIDFCIGSLSSSVIR